MNIDHDEYRAFENQVKTVDRQLRSAILDARYERVSPPSFHTANAIDYWVHKAKLALMKMNEGEYAIQKQRCPYMRESERQLQLLIKVGSEITSM